MTGTEGSPSGKEKPSLATLTPIGLVTPRNVIADLAVSPSLATLPSRGYLKCRLIQHYPHCKWSTMPWYLAYKTAHTAKDLRFEI